MVRLGLDDAQLARRMGVAKLTVASWKSDKHAIRRRYIPRLAEMLGLERVDLSAYDGLPAPSTVRRMAKDNELVKTRLAGLESRVTNLETAMHKRLDGMQKQIDNIGARLSDRLRRR
jgi:hypothetical protein